MKQLDVVNPFNNAPVWYAETIDTTMRAARELFFSDNRSGLVVSAGFQSSGRGRTEQRRWDSSPGDNLLMTIALDKKDFSGPLQILPLLAGMGVAVFLESFYSLQTEIKWPNDVLVHGRKICGILCESSSNCLLVGIGMNLWQQEFPPALAETPFPPTSVIMESPLTERGEREKVIQKLLTNLHTSFRLEDWRNRLQRRLYGMNRVVEFTAGGADCVDRVGNRVGRNGSDREGNLLFGVIQGVSEDGGLIIDSATWYAGEISGVQRYEKI